MPVDRVTPREVEVLVHLALGESHRQIARTGFLNSTMVTLLSQRGLVW